MSNNEIKKRLEQLDDEADKIATQSEETAKMILSLF